MNFDTDFEKDVSDMNNVVVIKDQRSFRSIGHGVITTVNNKIVMYNDGKKEIQDEIEKITYPHGLNTEFIKRFKKYKYFKRRWKPKTNCKKFIN